MFSPNNAFSSFSVNDIEKAKEFYGKTLGIYLNPDLHDCRINLKELIRVIFKSFNHGSNILYGYLNE